jgi:hypothetical protein
LSVHGSGGRLGYLANSRDLPAGGRRVKFSGGNRTVINGPFAESKELVAGYWILQVKSMDEAVEWAKRVPFEALSRIYPGEYSAVREIEIRQLFEPEVLTHLPSATRPASGRYLTGL